MKNVVALFLVITVSLSVFSADVLAAFSANTDGQVNAVAVQLDGKILVGGEFTRVNGYSRVGLARLNQDGSLDTGFKINDAGTVKGIALDPSGKILVGGEFLAINGVTVGGGMVRLLPDGTLDSAFNVSMAGFVRRMVVQPDGKILVGGEFSGINESTISGFARLNSNGTLDTGFKSVFNPNDPASIYAIALRSDGKILLGGDFNRVQGTSKKFIVQLNADGSLDPTFTNNMGLEAVYIVHEIIIQPDGKVLATGDYIQPAASATSINGVARFNIDGSLDRTFVPIIKYSGGTTLSMVLQPDGKIVLGALNVGGNLTRLASDGSVDASFVDPKPDGYPLALALQKDGKILLGSSSANYKMIARFLSNGSLDTAAAGSTPVDGVCGSAHGSSFAVAPAANLCSAGSASTVTGSGPWNWSCTGSNNGATASCSASLQASGSSTGMVGDGFTVIASPSGNSSALTLSVTIKTGASDVGKTGNVFLLINYLDLWFLHNGIAWIRFDGSSVPSYSSGPLPAQTTIPLLSGQDVSSLKGLNFFAGYGASTDEMLKAMRVRPFYTVK
ncbi:MAG: delta-60 repeat domain-containing protein [Desulfuromonadales bacterium]